MTGSREIERYQDGTPVDKTPPLPEKYRAILSLRRKGVGYDEIADTLGYNSRFEVIDILNEIYKRIKPINVEEVRDSIEAQIDDLTLVYSPPALSGNEKAARFVLKALELKAKMRGAILPPQVNIQVNNEKPWQRVFAATLSDVDDEGNIVVEGELVDDKEEYDH